MSNTETLQIKTAIIANINQPGEIEKLYRKNKNTFAKAFESAYPNIKENAIAQVWHERLHYKQEEISWGKKNEMIVVVIVALTAGLMAKLPEIFSINEERFYSRNIAFLIFPFLIAYFSWKNKQTTRQLILPVISIVLAIIYINMLPGKKETDAIILACIHLPFMLWAIAGYTFIGGDIKDAQKKIGYLRFNGDFVVMSALIVLSGIIFSGLTIGLFDIIHVDITTIYFQYIVIFGLAAVPVVGTYLVLNNPQLVNKISPVIARIFTPFVLVTLLIFISSVIYTGNYPYDDRNALMIFNGLLIGVMALILFSVSEVTKNTKSRANLAILLGLSALTIVINGIALSAILFRLQEFGVTPNRIAVLGANLLILVNLSLVSYKLFRIVMNKGEIEDLEKSMTIMLPVYGIWACIVSFGFPLLFDFM
ncbi:MAG: hypothetical protein RL394_1572 [Bacteroidota bacterium]|jgi:hypothetical protein